MSIVYDFADIAARMKPRQEKADVAVDHFEYPPHVYCQSASIKQIDLPPYTPFPGLAHGNCTFSLPDLRGKVR